MAEEKFTMNRKIDCCEASTKEPAAIFWNPYNEAVQCHNCGHVYVKQYYDECSDIHDYLDGRILYLESTEPKDRTGRQTELKHVRKLLKGHKE